MALTFNELKSFLAHGLTALGYADTPTTNQMLMPIIAPGPVSAQRLLKLSPQSIVFLILGSGAGLTTEQLFDQLMVTVRVVGRQNDYDYAEQLSLDVDFVLLQVSGNTQIGATQTLSINRTGGRPALLDYDTSDRYHFTGSYIAEAASSLIV